jgi:hypothetical protein
VLAGLHVLFLFLLRIRSCGAITVLGRAVRVVSADVVTVSGGGLFCGWQARTVDNGAHAAGWGKLPLPYESPPSAARGNR